MNNTYIGRANGKGDKGVIFDEGIGRVNEKGRFENKGDFKF